MKPQMMRVISSPSSSTMGVFTLIFAIQAASTAKPWSDHGCLPRRPGWGKARQRDPATPEAKATGQKVPGAAVPAVLPKRMWRLTY
jgi:hypothetical protein